MKYVRADHAREVIERVYPEASNIRITQVFREGVGWQDVPERGGYPLKFLPNLFDQKKRPVTAVQLRLCDRHGEIRYPDYKMEEFVEEFVWKPGDVLEVNVNQGWRQAVILAVLGQEALLEYEMPAGTTALWVIDAGNPTVGCKRNVSYKACPKKWRKAMEEAGTQWEGNGQ